MMGTFHNKYEPAPGKLLISEPFLFDMNFRRSVVLLCEHEVSGSVGFILNRTLDMKLADVLEITTATDIPLHLGGPVQSNTLHYIHMDEQLASTSKKIGEGLYWGGDFDTIVSMLENGTLDVDKYRFFLGYSGWTTGQLEEELSSNSWIVTSLTGDRIFHTDEEAMWTELLKDMGGYFKLMAAYPESPQLN